MKRIDRIILFCCCLLPTASIAQTHKVSVKAACGFAGDVKSEYECADNPSAEITEIDHIVNSMMHSKGNKILVYFEDCAFVTRPITALTRDGRLEIIVNAKTLLKFPHWYLLSMLAHELGHITNGHIYMPNCVTRDHELSADYYAGFLAHEAKCPSLDLAMAPFRTVPPDADHPPTAQRLDSVRAGWNDQQKPFYPARAEHIEGVPGIVDFYGRYLDLLVTATPFVNRSGNRVEHRYKIKFHLVSKDMRLSMNTVFPTIQRVSYSVGPASAEKPAVMITEGKDNFSYTITGIFENLPVRCTVWFVDSSQQKLTAEFNF
jgi:hypothetical protein